MPTQPLASPTDPATLARAERARRNGACSRGPRTPTGKARSSRNALKHGLRARVHLVLERDDEASFQGLAEGLVAELAPKGTLEGFLVARLAAAMWQTGRSERLEAQAFAAGPAPDADKLRLALRYRGSAGRELFRSLRALQDLRRRAPLPDAAGAGDRAPDLPGLAEVAWGGERAPPIPPGYLELRPVSGVRPQGWQYLQHKAYPGDVPLLVYADGTVRSPEGQSLEDVWSPAPASTRPPAPTPPGPASPAAGPRHGLTVAGPAEAAAGGETPRPNEP